MPRRRPGPTEIGATQAPDVVSSELRLIELDRLDPEFELARVRIGAADLRKVGAGVGRIEGAQIENVDFEDSVLRGADFQGARLRAVRFAGCQLLETDFTKAKLDRVDLRGSELAPAGSLLSMRGAIVDSIQLLELSRPLANELGIRVED